VTPAEIPELRTPRLLMRAFTEDDLEVWNMSLFADPEVTRYLPIDGPLTDDQLAGALERARSHWATHGYGVWAVCGASPGPSAGSFLGHCGLRFLEEVGETELYYALARPAWGQGLTTEAAGAALGFGFDVAGLQRIVAYAVPANRASTNVMTKLGMAFEAETAIFGLRCARYAIQRV
jgi:ribosomal-protein-alanine N-acetyltransferase